MTPNFQQAEDRHQLTAIPEAEQLQLVVAPVLHGRTALPSCLLVLQNLLAWGTLLEYYAVCLIWGTIYVVVATALRPGSSRLRQ